MKELDIERWNRKELFRFFKDFDDPYFSLTANVDVTHLRSFCKDESLSFSLSALHCALKAANSIREFRIRILGGKVFEFDIVHGSQPILLEDDTFLFCLYDYDDSVRSFNEKGRMTAENCRAGGNLDENPERFDQIFFSVIPWVSFTSFKNAQHRDDSQTVPRIVFGKVFDSQERKLMPVSVEVHHGVVDGIHVGRFFERFQLILNDPS